MSRHDRQAQLAQLESVIEKKKREIQAKLEAKKKKETESALLKIQKAQEPDADRPFWKKGEHAKEYASNAPIKNVFSNDGSFLEQFKKLTSNGLTPNQVDVETLAKARKAEEYEKERRKRVEEEKQQREIERKEREAERERRKLERERERDNRDVSSNTRPISPPRKILDTNIKLDLPPPGVVQLVPSTQVQILPSVIQQQSIPPPALQQPPPLIQPPPSNLIFTPLSPPPLMSQPPNPPAFTTNEIQMKAAGLAPPDASISNRLVETQNTVPLVPPFPPPTNFPPPFPPPNVHSQPPPTMTVPPPNMPSPMTSDVGNFDFLTNDRKRRRQWDDADHINTSSQFPPTGDPYVNHSKPAWPNARPDPITDVGVTEAAKLIAEQGDSFEQVLRERSQNEPHLRFLLHTESPQYLAYRRLVVELRETRCESPKNPDKYDPAECGYSDDDDDDDDGGENGAEQSDKKEDCDGYQADREDNMDKPDDDNDDSDYNQRPAFSGASSESLDVKKPIEFVKAESKRPKKKSRWGDKVESTTIPVVGIVNQNLQLPSNIIPATPIPRGNAMLTQVTRRDPGLIQYALKAFGSTNLSEEDWKRAEDHYKVNLLYQDMMKKRAELDRLAKQGKFKYEYDSDEDIEGGTWEHKLRQQEMAATQLWAEELTKQAAGKHHIGDFLPPDEYQRFLEKYDAAKKGKEPDLSDYKEFKLKEDNVGYQLLQKMGWTEGQGLGQTGAGIVDPVNKAKARFENAGLGLDNPGGLNTNDDEYEAYRKRMMLAYRFRPNPLNNPRRPYY